MNIIKRWKQKHCMHEFEMVHGLLNVDGWLVRVYACKKCGYAVVGKPD